jgi:UDP:flavonoid glycosyltransferase YjiC (YdhE family)
VAPVGPGYDDGRMTLAGRRLRVLWSFIAQQGCWYPAMGLVQELRARGHEVVALSRATMAPTLAALGIELRIDRMAPWPAELGAGGEPPATLDQALRRKIHVAGAHRDQVARLLREERFDVVLADGFRLGAGFAADAAGVPWASYTHHHFDDRATSEGLVQMWWDHFRPDRPLREVFVAWWELLRAELDLGPERTPEAMATWWNQSPHAAFVLGLPELLRHAGPRPGTVRHVGPSLWDGLPEAPPAWLARLDGGRRPAVLVALSAGTYQDAGTLVAAARAARDRDVQVIATLSLQRELPALPEGTIVVLSVPHGMVLPYVSAVVATGGLGTVTRAACAGRPAVLVPRANDQLLVTSSAVAAGMAISLPPAELDEERMGAALDRALTDGALASAAAGLRDACGRYDAPGTVADVVEALAR